LTSLVTFTKLNNWIDESIKEPALNFRTCKDISFLGPFIGDITKILKPLPKHNNIRISFTLFFTGKWDKSVNIFNFDSKLILSFN
jgi:hypothetical protein